MNIIIVFIICILIFFLINYFLLSPKEYFCYGNTYCNGNKEKSLCINQHCLECGLSAKCQNDSTCGPNKCIDGCCDSF